MIKFHRLDPARKADFDVYLKNCGLRGCEYSFANLNMWGRQRGAFVNGYLVLFSQFDRRSVYPFPIGQGEIRPVLDAVIADARERGIPCCFSAMTKEDCQTLERLYPGKFRFHSDRGTFDYIYDINDLADLRGRKFQRKRNHLHRFRDAHPDCVARPLTAENLPAVRRMVDQWFAIRLEADPHEDFHLERVALERAFSDLEGLGMEGLVLEEQGEILAVTIGSPLSDSTFDVHFEKARLDVEGAYNAINFEFARYLRQQYPALRWLNREDDMGLEGLRKAKLSYCPAMLLEKYWARYWEDADEI